MCLVGHCWVAQGCCCLGKHKVQEVALIFLMHINKVVQIQNVKTSVLFECILPYFSMNAAIWATSGNVGTQISAPVNANTHRWGLDDERVQDFSPSLALTSNTHQSEAGHVWSPRNSSSAASELLPSSPENLPLPRLPPFQERGHLVAARPREQNLHFTELISQKPDSHIGTDAEWQSRKVSALARVGESEKRERERET